jgi:hypothetical protein
LRSIDAFAFRIEWNRVVLVRDHPFAIDLAEADRGAPPHLEFAAVLLRGADLIQAVAESNVAAGGDDQVANLVTDRAFERSKPLLGARSRRMGAAILQRVDDIERQNIG